MSKPLTFRQSGYYMFSMDNTTEIKRGDILE